MSFRNKSKYLKLFGERRCSEQTQLSVQKHLRVLTVPKFEVIKNVSTGWINFFDSIITKACICALKDTVPFFFYKLLTKLCWVIQWLLLITHILSQVPISYKGVSPLASKNPLDRSHSWVNFQVGWFFASLVQPGKCFPPGPKWQGEWLWRNISKPGSAHVSVHPRDGGAAVWIRHCQSVMASLFCLYDEARAIQTLF